ncbi:hypothetical protein BD413DRAFT_29521 [Trametes elegans]|nr:hypothetical protein BD413DRAFT_29521 [Trametes elegans]
MLLIPYVRPMQIHAVMDRTVRPNSTNPTQKRTVGPAPRSRTPLLWHHPLSGVTPVHRAPGRRACARTVPWAPPQSRPTTSAHPSSSLSYHMASPGSSHRARARVRDRAASIARTSIMPALIASSRPVSSAYIHTYTPAPPSASPFFFKFPSTTRLHPSRVHHPSSPSCFIHPSTHLSRHPASCGSVSFDSWFCGIPRRIRFRFFITLLYCTHSLPLPIVVVVLVLVVALLPLWILDLGFSLLSSPLLFLLSLHPPPEPLAFL